MGEIDKEKEVMVILDFESLFKRDLLKERPKMEVLNAKYILYFMTK